MDRWADRIATHLGARCRRPTSVAALSHGLADRIDSGLSIASLVFCAVLAGCASSSRPYYQDDGPPERVPPGLANIADAVPRAEPLHRSANRPYVALGRSFTPQTAERPYRERGVASWYGRQFHGNRTASGEIYDMFAMTAAHPTLPIPSYAAVTHLATGRKVVVRINDRGPFLHGRIIDLSYAAAVKLGIAAPGSGEVELVRVLPANVAQASVPPVALAPLASAAAGGAAAMTANAAEVTGAAGPSAAVAAPPAKAAAGPDAPAAGVAPRYAVQLGVFSVASNAAALRERLAVLISQFDGPQLAPGLELPRVESDPPVWRVLVGGSATRAEAAALAEHLQRLLQRDATVVAR